MRIRRTRYLTLIVGTVVTTALAFPLGAQNQSRFTFAWGLEQSAQKNQAESPYVYSGWGWTSWLGYGRSTPVSSFELSLGGGFGGLQSDVAGGSGHHGTATLAGRYLRRAPLRLAGASWMAGASLGATTDVTDHQYAGRPDLSDEFGYGAIELGPAVRTSFRVKHATISNDLALPLVNAVDFPYANLKMEGGVHLRFATLPRLIAFDDALSYGIGDGTRRNVRWTYRLTWLRYDLTDTRTFVRHSVSLVMNFPTRRKAP